MTSSPSKNAPQLHPSTSSSHLNSPRSPGRLRKMQSAHQLSNAPSLISQQRQQQQRNTSSSNHALIPPIPALPSPEKYSRTRANSDAKAPLSNAGVSPKHNASPRRNPSPKRNPSPRRLPMLKKQEDPKEGLRSLIRRGPKGNAPDALQELRYLILTDGLESDNDGMVMDPKQGFTCGTCH